MNELVQYIIGKKLYYIMGKTIQYKLIIGEWTLLLKGHSRSNMNCKALYLVKTRTHITCDKRYKVECKVTETVAVYGPNQLSC